MLLPFLSRPPFFVFFMQFVVDSSLHFVYFVPSW